MLPMVLTVLANVPATAQSSEQTYDCEVDGIYYNLDCEAMTAEVTYLSNDIDEYDSKEVTFFGKSLHAYGAEYAEDIWNGRAYWGDVVIPGTVEYGGQTYSVTRIGVLAFNFCGNLKSVSLPQSVTSIGAGAFYRCNRLLSVEVPGSVTDIGEYAFSGCSLLKGLDIPSTVTDIGENAFANCSSLSAIVLPNTITSIEDATFSGCFSLRSFVIPESVTRIGRYAFSGCSNLASIRIPDSVTSIVELAFSGCKRLTSVTLGNSVASIGQETFEHCGAVTSMACRAVTPPSCEKKSLNDIDYNACPLYVPQASIGLYREADGWKQFADIRAIEGTGIGAPASSADARHKVYDVDGRQLPAPRKGLSIVDGRKVVML